MRRLVLAAWSGLVVLACASAAVPPPAPPPPAPDPCASGAPRARVEALLRQGRLDRALRVVRADAAICPKRRDAVADLEVQALAEIGRGEEATALADAIDASSTSSAAARAAAAAARKLVAEGRGREPADDLLAAAKKASDDVDRQRLLDRALTAYERAAYATARVEPRAESYDEVVAWSPDDALVAVGAPDDSIALVDTRSMVEQLRLRGHTAYITSTQFSPDGRTIATASADGTVRVWDTRSGAELRRLVLSHQVRDIRFSNDGAMLSVDTGKEPFDWVLAARAATSAPEPEPPAPELRRKREKERPQCEATSPKGDRSVTVGADHVVRFVDGGKERARAKLLEKRYCERASFSADGKLVMLLYLWGQATRLVVLDAARGTIVRDIEQHGIRAADFVGDEYVVLQTEDEHYVELQRFVSMVSGATTLRIDGRPRTRIDHAKARAAWVDDGTLRVADIATGATRAGLVRNGVANVRVSRDGKRALGLVVPRAFWGSGATGLIVVATDGSTPPLRIDPDAPVLGAALKGEDVVAALGGGSVRIWDASSGKETARLTTETGGPIAVSPDGTRLVMWIDEALRTIELPSGRELSRVAVPKESDNGFAVRHRPLLALDGRHVLLTVGHSPASLPVLDTFTGAVAGVVHYDEMAGSAAFLPDGTVVVSESEGIPAGANPMTFVAALLAQPVTRESCRGSTDRFRLDAAAADAGTDQRTFSIRQFDGCGPTTASYDGKALAIAQHNWIDVRQIETGRAIAAFDDVSASSLALSEDGAVLVSGGDVLRVMDTKTQTERFAVEPVASGALVSDRAGRVEPHGDIAPALVCRVGARALPFELCAERWTEPALAATHPEALEVLAPPGPPRSPVIEDRRSTKN